jgi:hypothetical protein
MITMASIIERFESAFLAQYHSSMLPSQRHALAAMKMCRSTQGPSMLVQCNGCQERRLVPHSCGHRNCPPEFDSFPSKNPSNPSQNNNLGSCFGNFCGGMF